MEKFSSQLGDTIIEVDPSGQKIKINGVAGGKEIDLRARYDQKRVQDETEELEHLQRWGLEDTNKPESTIN